MSSQKYDWNAWFERKTFVLVHGTDYHVNSGTMYQQIRNAASQRGLRVSIHGLVNPDSIAVEVVGKSPTPAKSMKEYQRAAKERSRRKARELRERQKQRAEERKRKKSEKAETG